MITSAWLKTASEKLCLCSALKTSLSIVGESAAKEMRGPCCSLRIRSVQCDWAVPGAHCPGDTCGCPCGGEMLRLLLLQPRTRRTLGDSSDSASIWVSCALFCSESVQVLMFF